MVEEDRARRICVVRDGEPRRKSEVARRATGVSKPTDFELFPLLSPAFFAEQGRASEALLDSHKIVIWNAPASGVTAARPGRSVPSDTRAPSPRSNRSAVLSYAFGAPIRAKINALFRSRARTISRWDFAVRKEDGAGTNRLWPIVPEFPEFAYLSGRGPVRRGSGCAALHKLE